MKKLLKVFSKISIALIVFSIFIGYKYVNSDLPGLCRAQQRFIPDEDFITASQGLLQWQINKDKSYWSSNRELYKGQISSNSRLLQNIKLPGFIKVERDRTKEFSKWLLGYQDVQVILNANSGDSWIRFFYDSCGKLIDKDFGFYVHNNSVNSITTENYIEITDH